MDTWYTNLTLVDGTGAKPAPGSSVLVQSDGTIGAVLQGKQPDIDLERGERSDVAVVDCTGLVMTPGLIDAHSHLGFASDLDSMMHRDLSVAELAWDIFSMCGDALQAGFTTIRDCGGLEGAVPDLINRGRMPGPRVLTAGPVQCMTGGHGHLGGRYEATGLWETHEIQVLRTMAMLGDGPESVRRNVRETFRRGADFIKMCVTGGVLTRGTKIEDTQFTGPEIRAAVEEAESRGTYVTVHAHNNAGIRMAVEAGVKCVEHGSAIDDETADLMAENDVALVPTLAPGVIFSDRIERLRKQGGDVAAEFLAKFDEADALIAGMNAAIPRARRAGVLIGSGADITGPRQGERAIELVLRSEVEDPMAALVSSTRDNAKVCRLEDTVGTVTEGLVGDLCLWSSSPLDDPTVFTDRSQLALVLQGGTPVAGTRRDEVAGQRSQAGEQAG